MHAIEFRVILYDTEWGDSGPDGPIPVIDVIIDNTRLLDRVYRAELPFALAEQRERAAEFAPDPAPLLAGQYMCVQRYYGWPNRHLLGEPEEEPWFVRDEGETMVLTCTCGIDECWALMARIQVDEALVRWSDFRNSHRDWDLSALDFTFSRPQYEEALRATARTS